MNLASDNTIPFVQKNVPFVVNEYAFLRPFVDKNMPIVRLQQKVAGFTLVELIIVLTIAGILAALAGPSLSSFLNSNRLATATNDFIADLSLARSEAIKRGTNVTVCESADGATCTGSTSWENGWIVLAGGTVIRAHERLPAGTAVTATDDTIVYNGQGQIPEGTGDYTFCTSAIGRARTINLHLVGRHTLTEASC